MRLRFILKSGGLTATAVAASEKRKLDIQGFRGDAGCWVKF